MYFRVTIGFSDSWFFSRCVVGMAPIRSPGHLACLVGESLGGKDCSRPWLKGAGPNPGASSSSTAKTEFKVTLSLLLPQLSNVFKIIFPFILYSIRKFISCDLFHPTRKRMLKLSILDININGLGGIQTDFITEYVFNMMHFRK